MSRPFSRRTFLRTGFLGALSALAAACARAIAPNPSPTSPAPATHAPRTVLPAPATAPAIPSTPYPVPPGVLITPNDKFYTVTYLEQEPVEPEDWSLTVEGNVATPLTLSLAEIQQMPSVVEMRTLCCISNPPGGPLIGNAVWKGVRFRDVLERAGVKPDTLELYLIGDDGYDTSIPLELAKDPDSLLVYEMNGEPLPLAHGKPLRCLFPGRYGMKQPKWIVKITATTEPRRGYWDVQGWSKEAFIQPFARIDVPDELATITTPTLTVQGVGFSDAGGIKTIELSTDDGAAWIQPELVRGPTPLVWTRFEWQGATPSNGEHILLARTTDNSGKQQTRDEGSMFSSTFPDGTAGIQPVPIRASQ